MAFTPYLNFGGNCRAAFTRYHEIFGGDLAMMSMADMPSDEPVPPGMEDMVIHAALTFEGHRLYASDSNESPFGPVQFMYVHYAAPSVAEAERVFAALAEDGRIEMAIAPTFWSPMFGACVDRFGTPWMVDTELPAES